MTDNLSRTDFLPPPASGGESFSAYFTRVVIEDTHLADLRRRLRIYLRECPFQAESSFAPARFSHPEVVVGHDGLDRIPFDVRKSDQLINLLARNWHVDLPQISNSLEVRMVNFTFLHPGLLHILQHRRSITALPPLPDEADLLALKETAEMMALFRQVARHKDMLTARFCDDLRSRATVTSGFLANDRNRLRFEILPDYWSDILYECLWKKEELCPINRQLAPNGTPHFRGLMVSPAPLRRNHPGRRPIIGQKSLRRSKRERNRDPKIIKPRLLEWIADRKIRGELINRVEAAKWAKPRNFSVEEVRRLYGLEFPKKKPLPRSEKENAPAADE
jgi:hypothetical protein